MDLTRNKPTVLVIEPSGDEWLTMQWAFGKAFQPVEPVWIAEPALAMLYLEACLNSREALPKLVFISLSQPSHRASTKLLKLLKSIRSVATYPLLYSPSQPTPSSLMKSIPTVVMPVSVNPLLICSDEAVWSSYVPTSGKSQHCLRYLQSWLVNRIWFAMVQSYYKKP